MTTSWERRTNEAFEAKIAELAARLRRLEDLTTIHQLFVDYGRVLDAGDTVAYAEMFTEDGEVLLGPLGRAKGRDAIRELMDQALDGVVGTSFHLVTSPAVTLEGDTATASVMWTVIAAGDDGGPTVTMLGRHLDELRRVGDSWRFARRAGEIDLPRRYPTG